MGETLNQTMKQILVVDDEEGIRNSIKELLESNGFKVTIAEDGKECLKTLEKGKFDLILLDVMMPGMSGWDCMEEILKTKPEYKKKIIFLSVVEVSDERKKELLEKGVLDYLTKPFDIDTLVNRVKEGVS